MRFSCYAVLVKGFRWCFRRHSLAISLFCRPFFSHLPSSLPLTSNVQIFREKLQTLGLIKTLNKALPLLSDLLLIASLDLIQKSTCAFTLSFKCLSHADLVSASFVLCDLSLAKLSCIRFSSIIPEFCLFLHPTFALAFYCNFYSLLLAKTVEEKAFPLSLEKFACSFFFFL